MYASEPVFLGLLPEAINSRQRAGRRRTSGSSCLNYCKHKTTNVQIQQHHANTPKVKHLITLDHKITPGLATTYYMGH